ncbi:ASNSD1 upstream open reading frame protein-like [Anneissia japonica]|uniref:ASNSD1 upstream open reading frame protein-like n=1 Tax=Anneissia japonica TaxID=1529436 RepID=UPI0014256DBA|nr:ASNSD1 upstream open reading frame protein-like [Anneissia japonica]
MEGQTRLIMEVSKELNEQTVLKNELSSLKKDSRVYEKQSNSGIFFLSDQSEMLKKCHQKIQRLKCEEDRLKNPGKS